MGDRVPNLRNGTNTDHELRSRQADGRFQWPRLDAMACHCVQASARRRVIEEPQSEE
jgi:hypothetical protein